MLKVCDLLNILAKKPEDFEVRIADVSEGGDLHCSVARIELRGNCIVFIHGDDEVWKDETVAATGVVEHLWSTEDVADNEEITS